MRAASKANCLSSRHQKTWKFFAFKPAIAEEEGTLEKRRMVWRKSPCCGTYTSIWKMTGNEIIA
jgi:hypothetical protein